MSIGAGRLRIVRQLMTKVFAGVSERYGGVLCAIWGIRFLTLLLATAGTTSRCERN